MELDRYLAQFKKKLKGGCCLGCSVEFRLFFYVQWTVACD